MARRDEIPPHAFDILTDRPTGYLATHRPDGHLSVNPVGLVFDGRTVRISTTKARVKYRNMLADDHIAMAIPHRTVPERCLEIRGRARIEDDVDHRFVDRLASQYLGLDRYPLDKPTVERVTVTIDVEQVSYPTLPRRRNEALEMLVAALKAQTISQAELQEWMAGHDMDSDEGVEAMIEWLQRP